MLPSSAPWCGSGKRIATITHRLVLFPFPAKESEERTLLDSLPAFRIKQSYGLSCSSANSTSPVPLDIESTRCSQEFSSLWMDQRSIGTIVNAFGKTCSHECEHGTQECVRHPMLAPIRWIHSDWLSRRIVLLLGI